jgi:integrase/recombinase XerD
VGKAGSCHLFRHTLATLMLENGADVRYVQAMLGHASLQTTQVYTHVSIKALQEVHARTHPAAKLAPPHRDALPSTS